MRTAGKVEVLVTGYDNTEGPAFDRDGNLYFVDWEVSSIIRLTPEGEASEFFNTGGIPAGLAFHPDGWLYVADEGADIHGVIKTAPDGSRSEVVVDAFEGRPLNGANDLVFGRDGSLFFSDPWGSNGDNPIGGFYRLRPDGILDQIDSGLAFPNGVALDADERYVYLAETYRNRIVRYELRDDGSVGPQEPWADTHLPPGPDGMCFDAEGHLYVAHFSGGCVDIFDPRGRRVGEILVPGIKPTNCAFGGPDNKTLVITEVETDSVYRVPMTVAGLPLNDGRG